MSAATINKEFALAEYKRLNLQFWDLYSGDGAGMLTCQQNKEMTPEQSYDVLEKALSEVSGHKVKLKASLYSRDDKSKNPNSKNQIDSWVVLRELKTNSSLAGSDMIYALIEKNHALQMEMMRKEFEIKMQEAANNEKETALDRLSHTILNDPALKFGFLGILSKISGVPVAGNISLTNPGVINSSTSEEIGGVPVPQILAKLAEYEKNNPGAIKNVINTF